MEKSGQDEIDKEQESSEENPISFTKEGNSMKLNFIKEESETEGWSAVLSSPKHVDGSDGLIDPLLEDGNNCGENSDTDVEGWINDGMGNAVPSNHIMERGINSTDNNTRQHLQQVNHEHERASRQLLKCFHCDSTFSREPNLLEHMKVHAQEHQVFPSQSQLRRHARTHTPGKYSQGQKTRGRQGPKTTFPWTDQQEEELVEWWRQNESLYNSNSQGYLDRSLRERLFTSKAEEIGDGCMAEDVQTHLRSLRTKMNHILKEGQALGATPIGEGWTPRTPRCKWVWERLDFLIPFIIHRNIKSGSKFPKGSSGEDSPSGGSDVSMGVEIVPGTSSSSNDLVGPVPIPLRDSYVSSPARSRGKTKTARQDVSSKKVRMDVHVAAQEQELRTKSRTTELDQSLRTYVPHTTVHHQPQHSIDVQEAPTTSIPTTTSTTSHHQPVVSSDEEEVKAFLGHLKCTLLRIPADLRMEVQAEILAMVYARHKEHRQSCMQP
eukprot:XP_003723523.1 PREDICTED: uncharacterized protein LOC100889756 [Strongylocentrotus purpuratus]